MSLMIITFRYVDAVRPCDLATGLSDRVCCRQSMFLEVLFCSAATVVGVITCCSWDQVQGWILEYESGGRECALIVISGSVIGTRGAKTGDIGRMG